MKDIVLLAEVADLAERIEEMVEENPELFASAESDDDGEAGRKISIRAKKGARHAGIQNVKWKDDATISTMQSENDDSSYDRKNAGQVGDMPTEIGTQGLSLSMSGSIRMKDLLDAWEEPINKRDKNKNAEASIQDVLQFRRALELMDIDQPFGEAFGSASNRDECILSSHTVYHRLLKMTPEEKILPFTTLNLLSMDNDEEEKQAKSAALLKLFRPDRDSNVTLLAFIQSCDSLYRRLRYFRASVGNASVIDHVLEAIFDGLFLFILFLVNLSVLNFNP